MNVTRIETRIGRSKGAASESSAAVWSEGRMYAISFDLNQAALERHYKGAHPRSAYDALYRVFASHGFERRQGSLYFGRNANPVTCILAVQDADRRLPWFRHAVTDIRMLRVEENNDLMPVIGQGELPLVNSDAAD